MSRPAASPRLSGPGELAAALPVLCGFTPAESLVLVCLEANGGRVTLTVRLDLPGPGQHEQAGAEVTARLRQAGTTRAFALVLTDEPGRRPRQALVDSLVAQPGLTLLDVVLVRAGRWWSYLCTSPGCCPVDGTPVPAGSPGLTLVQARAALAGRAPLPSREALVATLTPERSEAQNAGLRAAQRRLVLETRRHGRRHVRQRLAQAFRTAMDASPAAVALLSAPLSAELALGLHDIALRDDVLGWTPDEAAQLLPVLLHLVRTTPPPFDAAACTCLAWVAYLRGDGATAAIALDRALRTDPTHGLAVLLTASLDAQVPPEQLAATARTARDARRSVDPMALRRRR